MEYPESAIFHPIYNKDHYHKEHKNKEEFAADTFNFKRFNIWNKISCLIIYRCYMS